MNLSPLAVGLIVTAFAALLAGLGWFFSSQVKTNQNISENMSKLSKSFSEIVKTFEGSMLLIEERSNNQKTLCQLYRDQINSKQKDLDILLKSVEKKMENINYQKSQS